MTCATRYAEAADFNTMGCDALDLTDPDVVTSIESLLEFAAGEISAALASVGACDCAFDSWVYFYLANLNVKIAMLDRNCPCFPKLSDNERLDMRQWVDAQLTGIRNGTIELCSGNTGSNGLAYGVVENNATEWSAAVINNNRRLRTGT